MSGDNKSGIFDDTLYVVPDEGPFQNFHWAVERANGNGLAGKVDISSQRLKPGDRIKLCIVRSRRVGEVPHDRQ